MQTKLLLSGLALALACAQGCNVDDDTTSEDFDQLEQRSTGDVQDAGRRRSTADAGADAGWDQEESTDDEDEEDDDTASGADGGCRRPGLGGRRGVREGRDGRRPSGDQAGPALDGGIGIPGVFGGARSGR